MNCFYDLKIQFVLAVPDSWSSKLISEIEKSNHIRVVLCATEVEALTICSGLNLSGVLSVMIMENTGVRSVGDILTRFELAHNIHNIFLLSDRGGPGEANWWGVRHTSVTNSILNELNIVTIEVQALSGFQSALNMALETFRSEQVSVALKLKKSFWDELI
ncbi:MAG: hypothetical protein IKN72_01750 [Clostridia bacterium]|nr:hypothetical protein [Clostridia bacterium]